MSNYKMVIDVSDVWQRYFNEEDYFTFEEFIDELVFQLDERVNDIGKKFGEDAQAEYEELLFNIQHNVSDKDEFDYYMDQLYDWASTYSVSIQTN